MIEDIKLKGWKQGNLDDALQLTESIMITKAAKVLEKQAVIPYSLAEKTGTAGFFERLIMKDDISSANPKETLVENWKAGRAVFLFGIEIAGGSMIGYMQLH